MGVVFLIKEGELLIQHVIEVLGLVHSADVVLNAQPDPALTKVRKTNPSSKGKPPEAPELALTLQVTALKKEDPEGFREEPSLDGSTGCNGHRREENTKEVRPLLSSFVQ